MGEIIWTLHHAIPGVEGWAIMAAGAVASVVLVACTLIGGATLIVRRWNGLLAQLLRCRLAWDELGQFTPSARRGRHDP